MYLANTLSRAYLPYNGSQEVPSEIESINMIQHHPQEDNSLLELIKVIKAGWPETKGVVLSGVAFL